MIPGMRRILMINKYSVWYFDFDDPASWRAVVSSDLQPLRFAFRDALRVADSLRSGYCMVKVVAVK